jgi:hypothetical protein
MSRTTDGKDSGKPPKVSEEAMNNIKSIVRYSCRYYLSFISELTLQLNDPNREGLEVLGQSADLYVGRELKGMWTEKEKGMSFYRMSVDAEDILSGFLVFCRSEHRHSFKLVLCDADGKVMYTEDSRRNCSEAVMYFTNIDTYTHYPVFRVEGSSATIVPGSSLVGNAPAAGAASPPPEQFAVPADECDAALGVFGALDGMKTSRKTIAPGRYLLCVLGTGPVSSFRGTGGAYTVSMALCKGVKDTVVRAMQGSSPGPRYR